jgi:CRISPR-associated protein Cas1
MPCLYLDQHGGYLGTSGNQLILKRPSGEKVGYPLHQIERVVISGQIHLSAAAIAQLLKHGIPTVFCGSQGHLRGQLGPMCGGQVRRRARQYALLGDGQASLGLARSLVLAKLRNQQRVLANWRRPDNRLAALAQAAGQCAGMERLRGLEGAGARCFFQGLAARLQDTGFEFPGRLYHPCPDPVNSLLSFGYALLSGELAVAAESRGMDRYAGVYHVPDGSQPALLLDLMEPMRPLVDRLVVRLLRRKLWNAGDFEQTPAGCRLKEGRRGQFLKAWEDLMQTAIHWRGEHTRYRRLMDLQVAEYVRFLDGETEHPAWWLMDREQDGEAQA